MNGFNGYGAKAWECLSLAETMNDPERRVDVGDHLRELYQPVSNESIPPRLADLLRRLDQSNGGRRKIKITSPKSRDVSPRSQSATLFERGPWQSYASRMSGGPLR